MFQYQYHPTELSVISVMVHYPVLTLTVLLSTNVGAQIVRRKRSLNSDSVHRLKSPVLTSSGLSVT